MAFSAIPSFVVHDDPGMQRWLLEHYVEHQNFNDALATTTVSITAAITDYPIQKMNDKQVWLVVHQRWHQAIWSALGAGIGADLASLDWNKADQVYSWLELHAQVHGDIRSALGL